MKKLLITFLSFATAWSLSAAAVNTTPTQGVFGDELNTIEQQFDGLNALEQVVNDRNATYQELAAENNSLLNNMAAPQDLGSSLFGASAPDERVLGIPGFWWGFCLGLLGVILCYVAIEDSAAKKREGKQALLGCIIWTVIWAVLYFAVFAASL